MIKGNPVGWFEIYSSDLKRAVKFYEGVFDTKLTKMGMDDPHFEMWAFPGDSDGTGANGTICKMTEVEPGNNSTIVYFSCEDCSVQENRALTHGGKVMRPKTSIGEYGFISLIYDTEGNLIGLHSMK